MLCRIGWMILVGVACCAVLPSSATTIYKCKGSNGHTVYQDTPCTDTSRTERSYHFHDDSPSGPGAGRAAAWQSAARQFARQHPDLAYGHNVALMNQAMSTVARPGMSNTSVLAAGYAKARALPGWTRSQDAGGATPSIAPTPANRASVGGLGVSADARGSIHAVRCTTATGRVYYARGECGTTTVTQTTAGRDWHKDTVEGVPGAVMVAPNEAVNPRTGRVVELQDVPNTTVMHVTTRDHAQTVSVDKACAKAQKAESKHPFSRKLTRKVQALCQQGRSLYDQAPNPNSLYGGH